MPVMLAHATELAILAVCAVVALFAEVAVTACTAFDAKSAQGAGVSGWRGVRKVKLFPSPPPLVRTPICSQRAAPVKGFGPNSPLALSCTVNKPLVTGTADKMM